jgi:hypothetical protein
MRPSIEADRVVRPPTGQRQQYATQIRTLLPVFARVAPVPAKVKRATHCRRVASWISHWALC